MSLRFLRVLAPIAVAALLALVVVVVVAGAASPTAAIARGRGDRALVNRCLMAVLGVGRRPAWPVSGSADPQVVSQFAVFRRMPSNAAALPTAAHLRAALAGAGATTYDPSAAVLLTRNGAHGAVYAVPATMALSTVPVGCDRLPHFSGVGAYLALRAQQTGSGPGACVVSTQLEARVPSGSSPPGAIPPKPTKTLAVTQMLCQSEAVLSSYVGALGAALQGSRTQIALIPDGVSAISYTLADGHRFSVPVEGNLATLPAALSMRTALRHPSAAALGRSLSAHLPTTVTENGPGGNPIATLTRPVSLVADAVGSFSFLRAVLMSSSVGTSSSSTSGASCRARTHRCVAVTVTTTCDSHQHCQTRRTIHRYRYVGARPPAGTTGPDTQPTAPIVARTNRLVNRPTKLTLVLSGTPHRRVLVLLSVNCFSRNSAASSGGPPLQLAVPSRTPIGLPGRTFHACDVDALVTSTQPGAVHVAVARG